MKKIKVGSGIIPIGIQGENLANQVLFPFVKKWKECYGEGTFQLLYQRPSEDYSYACVITTDEENVIWTITSTEVKYEGIGACELAYIVDNTIAKSITYSTSVFKSIAQQSETPPEPWVAWVEEVLQAAINAEEAKNEAVSAANSASGSADYAERQAGYAKASEKAAGEYVETASEKASDAEAAATAAKASKVAAQAAAQQAQKMIGTFETFNFSVNDWQALGADYRPYRSYAVKTAQTTIEANTIVEIMNNNPVAFAKYGLAIGAVTGQNITFYSTMSESFEVNGIEVRIYG